MGRPHSDEHGSIEDELVARASHTHALYGEDNASIYYQLEEAMRPVPMRPLSNHFNKRKMVEVPGLL